MVMQLVTRQVGGDSKIRNPQILDIGVSEIACQLLVVMAVIEQAIARPRIALHRAVRDEYVVRAAIDVVGMSAHGEGADHCCTSRRASHNVEFEPGLDHRFVETDMRCTQCAAAASNEAKCGAVNEAKQPFHILARVERHVVVHGDVTPAQPARRTGNVLAARMQQHEAACFGV